MNTGNAFGFVFLGLVMWLLPVLAPDLFSRHALDGASTRALWIQAMAVVHGVVGAAFLLRGTIAPALVQGLAQVPAVLPRWTLGAVPRNAVPVTAAAEAPIDFATADAALSEQRALLAGSRLETDGVITLRGEHAALWRALKVAFLDEERLMHFLQRLRFLAHRHRDGAHTDGTAPVVVGHHAQHALVHFIETSGINLQQLERSSRDWLRDMTSGAFLREVGAEIDQVVRHPRRAA